ncbi:hypothetical protein OAG34_00085 [bacterium]|nr:hypothetical protein [bacterium]
MLCFLKNRKHPGIAHEADAKHAVSVIHVSSGVHVKEPSKSIAVQEKWDDGNQASGFAYHDSPILLKRQRCRNARLIRPNYYLLITKPHTGATVPKTPRLQF